MSSFRNQFFPLFWTEAAPLENTVAQDSGSSHFLDKRMRYVDSVASLMKMCNRILLLPGDRSRVRISAWQLFREIVDEQRWGKWRALYKSAILPIKYWKTLKNLLFFLSLYGMFLIVKIRPWSYLRNYWSRKVEPKGHALSLSLEMIPKLQCCVFSSKIFLFYFLKLHLHNFSKLKSHKEVTKRKQSRFFLLFAWWLKDPDPSRIRIFYYRIRIRMREAQKTYGSYGSGSATLLEIKSHKEISR
jgi:hypothetical protein